ncbi:hypothetical protein [Comamonas aquatica]|uniref:hypothetical protein n=1 Tax=Comamonas aquatica TaxID=225991 RepID=UPI002446CF1A|nr:hypothetical protein [Comamonas aquatica]MDH0202776.1 hypothetical protein [Comamonas aquatica]MDH1447866.1 hypothetical protein [Comamonas aquatica]
MTQDQDFVVKLFQGFFKQKRTRETLSIISETEITGWEKWLQIELAKYCNTHEDIKTWGREARYELDKRSAIRSKTAIDFFVHQKRKHSPLGIELKQINSLKPCVKAMLVDKKKISRIKWSQDDLRAVWCVGVHHFAEPEKVKDLIEFCAKDAKASIDIASIHSEAIGRTGYSFTVLT